MGRRISLLFGIVTVGLIFALGFSGSSVDSTPSSPSVARVAATPSVGGSTFWWLRPTTPPLSQQADTPPETDGCPQGTARIALPCEDLDAGVVVGAMAGVDRWRGLVERHFAPEDVDRALDVIRCESNGNPAAANPISTARGLFQHLESAWSARAVDAGRPGADIFDPEDNVAVAAWLVYHGGGWSHWNASSHCW